MGVSKKVRTDETNRYGSNNNAEVLTKFIKEKLESRFVNTKGLHFTSEVRRGKVMVNCYRFGKWIASANVNRNGEIKYSMPGTDVRKTLVEILKRELKKGRRFQLNELSFKVVKEPSALKAIALHGDKVIASVRKSERGTLYSEWLD